MLIPTRIRQKYKTRIATFTNERLLMLQKYYKCKIKELETKYPCLLKKNYQKFLPPLNSVALYKESKTYLSIITDELWKREHEWNIQ